jgi:hypothetical protein
MNRHERQAAIMLAIWTVIEKLPFFSALCLKNVVADV